MDVAYAMYIIMILMALTLFIIGMVVAFADVGDTTKKALGIMSFIFSLLYLACYGVFPKSMSDAAAQFNTMFFAKAGHMANRLSEYMTDKGKSLDNSDL